jgi:hypothetical protein
LPEEYKVEENVYQPCEELISSKTHEIWMYSLKLLLCKVQQQLSYKVK